MGPHMKRNYPTMPPSVRSPPSLLLLCLTTVIISAPALAFHTPVAVTRFKSDGGDLLRRSTVRSHVSSIGSRTRPQTERFGAAAVDDAVTTVADVGIIGAGPAALALSHALISRGYSVRVFERRTSFRPVGAAVFMHPIALNALRDVSPELEERLRSVCTPIRKISLTSIVDETMDIGTDRLDDATEVFGSPFVSVRFWDMLKALKEGLPDDIFRFGHEMTRFEQLDGAVRLHFRTDDDDTSTTTPSSTVRYLIDAGGIRSPTRRQILGDSPIPRLRATFAVAPASSVARTIGIGANGDRSLTFVLGTGVSVTTASLSDGAVWWTQTRYDDDPTAPTAPSYEGETLRERLEERFAPWPEEIRGLVEATEEDDIIECTVGELPLSGRWGEGDVTLLGDAAHAQLPSLGLGVSTAFGDVRELCRQIDRGGGLDRRAMRWYEFVRLPQTAVLQLASRLAYFANFYLGNKKPE